MKNTWLRVLHVDSAVFFAVLTRCWQALATLVTLVLIGLKFSPELQGFYYTFTSVLALQSIVELGFYVVIINLASHEWAGLYLHPDGRIGGDASALSRLVSLGRLIFVWYCAITSLFVTAVGIGGFFFFSGTGGTGVHWQMPWATLVILTGMLLWALPFSSLLEGCNQVATLQRFRFSQVVLEATALWTIMWLGGGLWAAVGAAAVKLLRDMYLLLVRYRRFFVPFFSAPAGPRLHWKTHILPMQWRLALSGLASYLTFNLFNPVMFYHFGAAVAGQMGVTLTMVHGVQSLALAWVANNVPRYGVLIAHREFDQLDRLWTRTSAISVAVAALGALIVWLAIVAMHELGVPFSARMLHPLPAGLFFLAMVLIQIGQCQTAYLRAHRREPIVVLNVTMSLFTAVLVWRWGKQFGPTGAATAYLSTATAGLIWETLIFARCRARWHQLDAEPLAVREIG